MLREIETFQVNMCEREGNRKCFLMDKGIKKRQLKNSAISFLKLKLGLVISPILEGFDERKTKISTKKKKKKKEVNSEGGDFAGSVSVSICYILDGWNSA